MLVLSSQRDLFDAVRRTFADDARFVVTNEQVHCDGTAAPLTNIYATDVITAEWENWLVDENVMPDPLTLSHLIFECRSAAWVAEVGGLIAANVKFPVWVVDGADAVWPAGAVDPDRVVLM